MRDTRYRRALAAARHCEMMWLFHWEMAMDLEVEAEAERHRKSAEQFARSGQVILARARALAAGE